MSSQTSRLDCPPWRTPSEIGARVAVTLQRGLPIGAVGWHAADGLSHQRSDEVSGNLIRYNCKELRRSITRMFDKSVNRGLARMIRSS
jgi:hypothetical protein